MKDKKKRQKKTKDILMEKCEAKCCTTVIVSLLEICHLEEAQERFVITGKKISMLGIKHICAVEFSERSLYFVKLYRQYSHNVASHGH